MSKKVKMTTQAKRVGNNYAIVDIGEDGLTLTTVYKGETISDLEDFIQDQGYSTFGDMPETWRFWADEMELVLFDDDLCFTKVCIDR